MAARREAPIVDAALSDEPVQRRRRNQKLEAVAFDVGQDRPVTTPAISYLVCANQRSGTEVLCRALSDTGIAGHPEEYFLAEDPSRLPDWRFWEEGPYATAHGVTDRESYVELV